MRLTKEEYLARYFQYHRPTGAQVARMGVINDAAAALAAALFDGCPESAERTLALRSVEDARMRANQAIVVNEGSE